MTKPSTRVLMIPRQAWEDVRALLNLSPGQIQTIMSVMRSIATLKTNEEPYLVVAREAKISPAAAIGILYVVENIIRQRGTQQLTDDQLLEDLAAGCPQEVKALKAEVRSALLGLLSRSDEGYVVANASRLRSALVPSFSEATTVCDVRPVFDQNKKKIECGLLMVILGITAFDEAMEEQNFVVQMNREGLGRLKKALEEAEGKLDLMTKQFGAGLELI